LTPTKQQTGAEEMKEMKEKLYIPLGDASVIAVDPSYQNCYFAVHREILNGEPKGKRWIVSHKPTGKSVTGAHNRVPLSYRDARKLADWLDERPVFRTTRIDDMREAKDTLDEGLRRLYGQGLPAL
jgi:hypothetical protein